MASNGDALLLHLFYTLQRAVLPCDDSNFYLTGALVNKYPGKHIICLFCKFIVWFFSESTRLTVAQAVWPSKKVHPSPEKIVFISDRDWNGWNRKITQFCVFYHHSPETGQYLILESILVAYVRLRVRFVASNMHNENLNRWLTCYCMHYTRI